MLRATKIELDDLGDVVSEQGSSLELLADRATLKLTNNENVTGMVIGWEGETSEIGFLANKFKIVNPSLETDKQQVFTVGDINGVGTVGIDGNIIIDGSVLARSIATEELIVGDNIAMGANAYIEWSNVNNSPDIPNGTYIDGEGIYTGTIVADNISSGYLKTIHISVGDAANAVDFYEDGYSTIPLASTAYSGWNYNAWVGTDIITNSSMYFAHNNLSIPKTRRIRSGTVKVIMTWTGIIDSAMSIYYRINGGTWTCIAEGADSQNDYGAASTSWAGDLTIPVNGYVEFGMRPTRCDGWYYNGEKLAMYSTTMIIQMGNF